MGLLCNLSWLFFSVHIGPGPWFRVLASMLGSTRKTPTPLRVVALLFCFTFASAFFAIVQKRGFPPWLLLILFDFFRWSLSRCI